MFFAFCFPPYITFEFQLVPICFGRRRIAFWILAADPFGYFQASVAITSPISASTAVGTPTAIPTTSEVASPAGAELGWFVVLASVSMASGIGAIVRKWVWSSMPKEL